MKNYTMVYKIPDCFAEDEEEARQKLDESLCDSVIFGEDNAIFKVENWSVEETGMNIPMESYELVKENLTELLLFVEDLPGISSEIKQFLKSQIGESLSYLQSGEDE
jgi:hypothetical protein